MNCPFKPRTLAKTVGGERFGYKAVKGEKWPKEKEEKQPKGVWRVEWEEGRGRKV